MTATNLQSCAACLALVFLSATGAGAQVDESPLPIESRVAFPELQWAGWDPVSENGIPKPFRPILLTHAGDDTNRIFVPEQQGAIHVFPNDPQVRSSKIFLDLSDRVVYNDKQNEEGLLGMAFHPNYEENGQFFIYYTTTDAPHTSVISRFRVSADDPNRAVPDFEEELLRIDQPYWNHNGGTIVFGPDGMLYIALGDGGSANDPHGNGQNLGTLLGSILRIDVDGHDPGKKYAIPPDNPFVGREDARGEIWAYGLRNVWRMSFDLQTGLFWAGDVGQKLWEEIDIIVRGGNYGWNIREGLHPFAVQGPKPDDMIDPIWEYHHDVGKSITGGHVYRGRRIPELVGKYLYADYVSGKIWALEYDRAQQKVVANHPLPNKKLPIISFGEDEQGEVYYTIVSPTGKGIYRFEPSSH